MLLVTDAGLAAHAELKATVSALRDASITCEVFAEVETNPRTTTAEKLARLAETHDVGGGVWRRQRDGCGEGRRDARNQPSEALAYVGKNGSRTAPLPFVAVPTTCGTGSEVTWVAVLTDEPRRAKVSLKGDAMFHTPPSSTPI